MAHSIVDALAQSQNWILDAVRVAAVWVAHADQSFDPQEDAAIRARLPDRPGGVPLRVIVDCFQRTERPQNTTGIAAVFAQIREQIAEESKSTFLKIVVQIAAADGKVSVGERHALLFLGDLIGRGREMEAVFKEETGLSLHDLPDLSDPAYWSRIEAEQQAASKKREEDQRQRARTDDTSSGQRSERSSQTGTPRTAGLVEALATLGLTGTPSREEIQTAYRRLAKIHHPDRYSALGDDAVAHATKTFQRINAAYKTLME